MKSKRSPKVSKEVSSQAPNAIAWLIRCSWLALFAAVGLSAWLLINRPLASVVVEGRLSVEERDAVQRVLTPSMQTRLLNLDLALLVDQVESLSWPQMVSVRRVWPDQVVVSVVKQQVVASWNDNRYLTSTGQIVSLVNSPGPLPRLRCAAADPQAALEIFQRLAALATRRGGRLVALTENSVGEWRVTLEPGLGVMLGQAQMPSELTDRLQRFFVVRKQRPDEEGRRLQSADARYANGIALRWDDLTEETQPLVATGHDG